MWMGGKDIGRMASKLKNSTCVEWFLPSVKIFRKARRDIPKLYNFISQANYSHRLGIFVQHGRFLKAIFSVPKSSIELFSATDPGRIQFSTLAEDESMSNISSRERLKRLGKLCGERLLKEYHVDTLQFYMMRFPPEHYLQRRPELVTGFILGLLEAGVKVCRSVR